MNQPFDRDASQSRQTDEAATLTGLLIDLGERQAEVTVRLVNGGGHHGMIGDVGIDYCRLDTAQGPVLIPLESLVAIRPAPGTPTGFSDRAGSDATLTEVLGDLAAERTEVALTTVTGDGPILGPVLTAGGDIVVIGTAGSQHTIVARDKIGDVRLTERSGAW